MVNQFERRLSKSNAWLLIAILALLGWTFDALRMFSEMHDSLSVGLVAFVDHFWYALPMLIAVIALNRLQPKARLLGIMAYDDTGELVHHQGDLNLDELTLQGTLSSLSNNGKDGLQSLALPSGATVYFLRQGGITLIASFTESVSPHELAASIRSINGSDLMHFDFIHDLESSVAMLARQLLMSPLKRKILTYFWQRKMTSIVVTDLAYWTHSDEARLTPILNEFVSQDLIQRQTFEHLTFYRLTSDLTTLERLERLYAWHDKWQLTLRELEDKIL